MLLALAGVTGVGKSYFKDKLVEKLNFEKIKIITTRQIRTGEKNNEDKLFVTLDAFKQLKKENKIAYDFELLGNKYAYSKEALFSSKNTVFELHYDTIYDFKKICPSLCTIYILPTSIELAKEQTRKRHLSPETELKRLKEIDEHYERIVSDKNLRNEFDYFVYNNYDEKSEDEIISLVKNICLKEDNSSSSHI